MFSLKATLLLVLNIYHITICEHYLFIKFLIQFFYTPLILTEIELRNLIHHLDRNLSPEFSCIYVSIDLMIWRFVDLIIRLIDQAVINELVHLFLIENND